MTISNPMFQPVDRRATQQAVTALSMQDGVRREVCKACGDAAVLAVQRAVSQAEAESKSLQLQLLDLESEVLFDFNSLQDELLEVQNVAETLQRQLEESEQKRKQEHLLKLELEQQVLQMSEEILRLKISRASNSQGSGLSEALSEASRHSMLSRMSSAEPPSTPDHDSQAQRLELSSFDEMESYDKEDSATEKSVDALEAQLSVMRSEFQAVTQELLRKKLELSLALSQQEAAVQGRNSASNGSTVKAAPNHRRRPWPVRCSTAVA